VTVLGGGETKGGEDGSRLGCAPHSPAEPGVFWPWDYCGNCGLSVPIDFMDDGDWYCPHCLSQLSEEEE
jgi:hypothetical protein